MKNVARDIEIFYTLRLFLSAVFLPLFSVCFSLCLSIHPVVCPPVRLRNSQPPWQPPKCIQILCNTRSSETSVWANLL